MTPLVVSARSRIAGLRAIMRISSGRSRRKQRLAAGETHAIDARAREHVDERAHLLELQDVVPRQPHVLGFGHAVAAAQIAAVGDRQPQIFQRPAEQIANHRFRPRSRRSGIGKAVRCSVNTSLQRPGICVPHEGQAPAGVRLYPRIEYP